AERLAFGGLGELCRPLLEVRLRGVVIEHFAAAVEGFGSDYAGHLARRFVNLHQPGVKMQAHGWFLFQSITGAVSQRQLGCAGGPMSPLWNVSSSGIGPCAALPSQTSHTPSSLDSSHSLRVTTPDA